MSRRNTPRRNKPSSKPAWVWFVLGAFAGGISVFVFLLDNLNFEHPQTGATEDKLRHPAMKDPELGYSKPRFDFHTLLKENEIKVPQPQENKAEDGGINRPQAAAPESYILQAASFRDAREAEKLRAQLTLLNLNVQVKANSDNRGTWHRVLVGPYQSRSKMAKARQLLADKRLMPLVLKRPGKEH
ncbi:MAG: SPOR domain-containing protein [Gammaproteobacteria bacterium]|nr:SPOR domain-containing protein [Gammaproteobacteria bacterium]